MKIFTTQHEFDHSWRNVTQANWRKYPNRFSPQVVHVDVLDRRVDPETGVLRTERLISCKQSAPGWISSVFGIDMNAMTYFREVSEVDAASMRYEAKSRNLTFSNVISLEESVTYTPLPESSSRTLLQQDVAIAASPAFSFAAVRSYVEDFCMTRFQMNAEKGRLGLEEAVKALTAASNAPVTSRMP